MAFFCKNIDLINFITFIVFLSPDLSPFIMSFITGQKFFPTFNILLSTLV